MSVAQAYSLQAISMQNVQQGGDFGAEPKIQHMRWGLRSLFESYGVLTVVLQHESCSVPGQWKRMVSWLLAPTILAVNAAADTQNRVSIRVEKRTRRGVEFRHRRVVWIKYECPGDTSKRCPLMLQGSQWRHSQHAL
jgi:hypothetical protein